MEVAGWGSGKGKKTDWIRAGPRLSIGFYRRSPEKYGQSVIHPQFAAH